MAHHLLQAVAGRHQRMTRDPHVRGTGAADPGESHMRLVQDQGPDLAVEVEHHPAAAGAADRVHIQIGAAPDIGQGESGDGRKTHRQPLASVPARGGRVSGRGGIDGVADGIDIGR